MKNFLFSLALVFAASHAFAQTTETRTVADFNGIRSSCGVLIELSQGEQNSVVVEASSSAIPKITTEVSNGILMIGTNDNVGNDSPEPKVKVTVKNLRSVEASGGAHIVCANQLTIDSLTINLSGAAEAKLNMNAQSVSTVTSGASELTLMGTASRLNSVCSGAAELKAYNLTTENVDLVSSGAASARVTATNKLKVTASGASDVKYRGNPAEKDLNAIGSGEIAASEKDASKSDTTRVRVAGYDVAVSENDDDDERSDREKEDSDGSFEFWQGVDLGVNGYLTPDNKLEMTPGNKFLELNYAKSYLFAINAWQKNIHIYKNYVNLGTGIGLSWYHYNFRNSYTLQRDAAFANGVLDSLKYKRNRLNILYVNVPLFLEFNTNNSDASHSFHFGGGVQFGYNIFQNKLRQKYVLDGRTYKNKFKNDYNINPFRYDVIARIGYGDFTIFGTYSLSTLFEKGKGPRVYPFAAGIRLDF
jgi:Putative auto-transporter adhesin, head GIN domain/Outer membrane protein beta-barrel domain